MYTIVINSQKGGSGKTMLCKHLSIEAERAGNGPVFLIDTDPQGTLTAWYSKREAKTPILVDVPFDNLSKGLILIKQHGATYCLIDTASGRTEIAQELFKIADLVIFPLQDSEDDLTAAPVTIKNIKAAGPPFVFVLTGVKPNTLITAQAAALLSRYGQVAETFITNRTGYRARWEKGQTVTEAEPKGPAAREMSSLWRNMKSCLHSPMRALEPKEVVNG